MQGLTSDIQIQSECCTSCTILPRGNMSASISYSHPINTNHSLRTDGHTSMAWLGWASDGHGWAWVIFINSEVKSRIALSFTQRNAYSFRAQDWWPYPKNRMYVKLRSHSHYTINRTYIISVDGDLYTLPSVGKLWQMVVITRCYTNWPGQ